MEAITDVWSEASPTAPANRNGARYLHLERLKVTLWLGAATFCLAFAWQMDEFMPPALVLAFWTVAESVALAGFCRLFVYRVPSMSGVGDIMKALLWAIAATLNVVFAWRKMKIFPPTLCVLVYAKATFVIFGGFYCLLFTRVARAEPVLPL